MPGRHRDGASGMHRIASCVAWGVFDCHDILKRDGKEKRVADKEEIECGMCGASERSVVVAFGIAYARGVWRGDGPKDRSHVACDR
jgi:hypothetical protein